MSHPSKIAGRKFETEVVNYLRAHGYPDAERRVAGDVHDRGDIAGVPGVVLECKAEKLLGLAAAMDESQQERGNADADYGFAVLKRRNHSAAGAYTAMPFWQLVDILVDLQRAKHHAEVLEELLLKGQVTSG